MSRLLRVELRRLWARRLTWWALAGLLGVACLTAFSVYGMAKPPSAEEVAWAQDAYEQELQAWEETGEEQVAECAEGAESEGITPEEWGCDQLAPRREWFLPPEATFVRDEVDLDDQAALEAFAQDTGTTADPEVAAVNSSIWNDWESGTPTIATSALAVLAVVFVLGVSFVTAETSSGALGMWLTFEPRRRRVFWSKAAAAGLGTVPVTVLGVVASIGAVYAVYAAFGTLGNLTASRWAEIAGFGGRVVVAGVAFAMIGAALGAMFRHAAAAAGAGAVLAVVGVVASSVAEAAQRWNPVVNITAWIESGAVYGRAVCGPSESGVVECPWVEETVSQTQGGLYLLGLTLVLLLVAALVFRRRDVS
ncbi:ABC transporter permease subunit [Isoptericola sp. 4D.3]|jgi:ABC-2 type transport system permease protein|uniref:ABC transporter permease subunit n=1 Tax=Isoptericola peretonis TaxID=2918523 RepID=A0ABT0J951_9MICO|nr:ABC transporter permease subunit [Isoptericola sp. 4D.3]